MQAEMLAGETYPYTKQMRERLLANCDPKTSLIDEVAQLNTELAEAFAEAVLSLITSSSISHDDIHLVGSHGHTLWHNVREDGTASASLQIGESAVIAERTGLTTINNMRARDIAVGGQGAPLTGYVDWLLLRHDTHWRAVQNIGGMGNVTFLPPTTATDAQPIAFDTGPGNALIDAAVMHYTDGAKTFDRDGQIARQGRIDEGWLADMLDHPYYKRDFPKTTGRELFGTTAAMQLIAEGEARGLTQDEIIATLTALTATNIVGAYQKFAPAPVGEVILGGGGQHNPVIVEMIQALLPGIPIRRHEDIGLNSDFKEALVFAVLAYETWHGRVGTLPSLTGARQATVLGQITPGKNFPALAQRRADGE